MIRLSALVISATVVAAAPSAVAQRTVVPEAPPVRQATTAPVTCWSAPVDREVADPFRPPGCRWCPGNRGIEYASIAGDAVRAVTAGRVAFDGSVAGRRYLSIDAAASGGRLRVTYGGLDPGGEHFAVGRMIERGQPLGPASGPVHLGVRWNGEYVDPAGFIDGPVRRARLVPVQGTPGRTAERRAVCG